LYKKLTIDIGLLTGYIVYQTTYLGYKSMNNKSLLLILSFLILAIMLSLPGCDELVTETVNTTVTDSTLAIGCFNCHKSNENVFLRPKGQWENSKHASAIALDTILTDGCDGAKCHTHEGYIEEFDSVFISNNVQYSVIGCFTCHDPHSHEYDTWDDNLLSILRGGSEEEYVSLANDSLYFMNANDKSIMCVNCHRDVNNLTDPVNGATEDLTITSDNIPHFSPQADVILGFNGFSFKSSSKIATHREALSSTNACLTCHYGTGKGYQFGEHTFRLADETEEYVKNCNLGGCHTDLTDFSSIEIISNIKIMSDSLEYIFSNMNLLDENNNYRTDTTFSPNLVRMFSNYFLYQRDGSMGVHNPGYFEQILSESVEQWDSLPVHVSFNADTTLVLITDTVTFSYSANGNIDSLVWNFTDTTYSVQNDGSDQKLLFDTAGIYEVSLTAFGKNPTNFESFILNDSIYVYNATPVASFTPTVTDTFVDSTITFTNNSTDADSYEWDFGDSTTSIETDPTHAYTTDGIFTVILIAINPLGSDTTTIDITINPNP